MGKVSPRLVQVPGVEESRELQTRAGRQVVRDLGRSRCRRKGRLFPRGRETSSREIHPNNAMIRNCGPPESVHVRSNQTLVCHSKVDSAGIRRVGVGVHEAASVISSSDRPGGQHSGDRAFSLCQVEIAQNHIRAAEDGHRRHERLEGE